MPKRLYERGPSYPSQDVHPKQKIEDAVKRTDAGDLADLGVGFDYSRSRVQARLGDNNARKLMKTAKTRNSYPAPSGQKVPKDD